MLSRQCFFNAFFLAPFSLSVHLYIHPLHLGFITNLSNTTVQCIGNIKVHASSDLSVTTPFSSESRILCFEFSEMRSHSGSVPPGRLRSAQYVTSTFLLNTSKLKIISFRLRTCTSVSSYRPPLTPYSPPTHGDLSGLKQDT